MLMDQSSWDDTLVGVWPPRPPSGDAVSRQSSKDKHWKRSPLGTSWGEGRAISTVPPDDAGAVVGADRSEADDFTRHHLVVSELLARLPAVRHDPDAYRFACAELSKHVTKLEELGPGG